METYCIVDANPFTQAALTVRRTIPSLRVYKRLIMKCVVVIGMPNRCHRSIKLRCLLLPLVPQDLMNSGK